MLSLFLQRIRLLLRKAIITAILLLLGLKYCDLKKTKEITSEELKRGEKTAVVFSPNSKSVVAITRRSQSGNRLRASLLRGGKHEPSTNPREDVQRIDGARGVRISISDKGNVTVQARTRGFCFEPGLGGGYGAGGYFRGTIDAQFAFSHLHGLNAGLGFRFRRTFRASPFVAYSYNFYSNSSVLVGIDTDKKLLIGIRVKL